MREASTTSERPRARVLRELRQGIADGRWATGMIPPESELGSSLDVSRSTVRAVLKQLEDEGLLRSEPGRGRVVVERQSGLMKQTVVILTPNSVSAEQFRHTAAEKAVEAAVSDTLRLHGRHVLALHAAAMDSTIVQRLITERPSGVVVDHAVAESAVGRAALTELADARIPAVVHGDMPEVQAFDRVVSDHERGCYELTRWLIAQGYRRIVRVWEGVGRPYWLTSRDRGFERAMREAGAEAGDPLRVACATASVDQEDPRAGEVFELRARQYAGFLADVLLRQASPQVLMAMNDVSMLLVARAARILGRTPGRDVVLVGYDNFWRQSTDRRFESCIPLATVDKHNDLIGQRMAELLLARMAGGLLREPQVVMVEPKLVVIDQLLAQRA